MATPSNPYAIPSTIDDTILNTTLAEYRGRLVDNAYNSNIILRILGQSDAKEVIDGGASIVENLIELLTISPFLQTSNISYPRRITLF